LYKAPRFGDMLFSAAKIIFKGHGAAGLIFAARAAPR
jgi:hypothetical protein